MCNLIDPEVSVFTQSISVFKISLFFSPVRCGAPFARALAGSAVDPLWFPQRFWSAPLLVSVQQCFGVSLLP